MTLPRTERRSYNGHRSRRERGREAVPHGYARFEPVYGETENELFFDDEKGHYELMRHGWKGHERIHGSVVHVDVRDGKAWIQYDGTEYGAANELLGLGLPRDRIVLTFKHPDTRKLTDFAVA